ncbi:E3 ubiquitin-protein ligase TRIM45-like [Saccoglossus kowalevskii]|uniref:E3 ubiquitin-protein ligase TRIM71-like n=1 Tax=Saccoglossus kowalevskii TaxID=10224 RepID=A0ABM0GLT6_SACKO|nr:PREDICTED: E3 ubiquitin-protein ligase TRIM71-like [Saccoglossus kowalevskii]
MASNFPATKKKIREEMLTCSLCLEPFRTPKVLPCLHSFCQHCLELWMKKNSGKLTCPICRREMPDNDVSALQTNFLLTELSGYMSTIKLLKTEDKSCEACQETMAVSRCTNCSQNLCEMCTKAHRNLKFTKAHSVIDLKHYTEKAINGVKKAQTIVYCNKHKQSPVEIYCTVCQIPLCIKCALIDHSTPGHRHQYLEEAAKDAKERLQPQIEELKNKIQAADMAITDVGQEMEKLSENHNKTVDEIDQHAQCVINHVLKKQTEAKQQLGRIVNNRNSKLESQKKNLELTKAMLESADDFVENIMKFASPSQCLFSLKNVTERLNHVLKDREIESLSDMDSSLCFIPNKNILHEELVHQQAELKVEVKGMKKSINLGDELQIRIYTRENSSVQQQDILVTMTTPDREHQNVSLLSRIGGVCGGVIPCTVKFKQEGIHSLMVKQSNQRVKGAPFEIMVLPPVGSVYSFGSEGSRKSYFNIPWGVAINNNGQIVVADTNNHRIQILDWRGHCLNCLKCDLFPKPFTPRDIAVSDDGKYFVTDRGNKQIVVCTEEHVITTFGPNEGINPYGVTLTNDGCVLVTDRQKDRHYIRKYTISGEHVMVTEIPGSTEGQPIHPDSVAVNTNNQIYISDSRNHRIQIMDSSLHYLKSFGSLGNGINKFNVPCGVDIDKDNNVYICDTGNKRICKYSATGELIEYIAEGKVDCPTCIAVSKDYPLKIVVNECRLHSIKMLYV